MIIYTDSREYMDGVMTPDTGWSETDVGQVAPNIRALAENIFASRRLLASQTGPYDYWQYLFASETAEASHYDIVRELSRDCRDLPEGILCLAGAGDKFHGQRNRSWFGLPGNIHLVAFFKPHKHAEEIGFGFTMLAAASVIEAIDMIPVLRGRAGIKWVNDIMIDNAKVCGFLAYTQLEKDMITSAITGIGLNVESCPSIEPTPFVPEAGSLKGFTSDPDTVSRRTVFQNLIGSLRRNYKRLLAGGYEDLLKFYRERSVIIGKNVTVYSDPLDGESRILCSGRVCEIGSSLELRLEGVEEPVTRGRVVLESD
jgi:biotin-[acetyl-CoA-carboxylase] ligase BirA-like protein